MKKKLYWKVVVTMALFIGVFIIIKLSPTLISKKDIDSFIDGDESTPAPNPVAVKPEEVTSEPKDTSALGGYNVLIADRGNNRIIEVTPDKKIVWEYKFTLPRYGLGADDAFFTDGGKSIIVNLEEYNTIEVIDYASKKVNWSYGVPGTKGSTEGMLNTPDDAYKLPNGNITVADIKNCRVLEISPEKKIIRQYGQTLDCRNSPGFLNKPNGDTPLPDGHMFISNIVGHDLVELDNNWQPVFNMSLPIAYPSDPQLTKAGNILVADYSRPGNIIEISRQGKVVWQYTGDGTTKLNKPSLAEELPNGNIISNDDLNHRVIVIDKNTKQIVWQYGVTGKPGDGPGQLNIPDGLDIIKRPATTSSVVTPQTIGSISRNANNFLDQHITVNGYVLRQETGYAIFSDESSGAIGYYDLPVSGVGVSTAKVGQKYTLQGKFIRNASLKPINGSPFVLELSNPPQLVK